MSANPTGAEQHPAGEPGAAVAAPPAADAPGAPGVPAAEPHHHPALAHHFHDLGQQHEAQTLGMWLFLSTELMVFGALFTGYTVYRTIYPHEFEAGSQKLNVMFAAINTVVLLTSSLTMALAVHAAAARHRKQLVRLLLATALLGGAFLVIKGFEYAEDYEKNLVPNLGFKDDDPQWQGHKDHDGHPVTLDTRHVKLFLMFYYIMTGLHAVHLIIGIGILAVLAWLSHRGRYTEGYYAPVEVGGLYWHFVDVVWIFLLPLLYLIGTQTWGGH
jgi:cytochrome c oxidase subunit 3